jgi:predicted RNA binding protein YcfA (HicA-like mRNA interferase family)
MAIGKVKTFSTLDMERILRNNGFECVRHRGDHRIWKNGNRTVVLSRQINQMICRRLIKENSLVL